MKALLDPREVKTAESRFFSKATIMEVSHPVASYYASFGTRYTKVVVDDLPFSMERKIWVDGLKIAFKDHGHMTGWWERPDGLRLKELKELAKPASFGRGSETVFDKDIRDGLEITADRIGIDEPDSTGIEAYELELAKMLQKYAPLGKKLQPKLYKMHIYCEGGHFKQHRDSLHAKNHYATLIIPLSSGYSGGELVFHDGGEQRSYKPYVGEFILFHTDVVHEVLPVTSTHPRVTLQFDVYLEDNKDPAIDVVYNPHNSASEANYEFEYKEKLGADPSYPSDKMMSDFVFHLRDFVAAHPNDNVCFLLTHKYPLVMDEANLKGEDLELYELLTKNGFNVKTTFVRERVTFYDSDEIDETHDTRHELEVMSYKQQQRLLQEILEQDELSTPNAFRTDQANDEKNDESEKTFLFLGSSAQFQFSKEKIYNPFTGNCPEEAEYVYVSIALTITILTLFSGMGKKGSFMRVCCHEDVLMHDFALLPRDNKHIPELLTLGFLTYTEVVFVPRAALLALFEIHPKVWTESARWCAVRAMLFGWASSMFKAQQTINSVDRVILEKFRRPRLNSA